MGLSGPFDVSVDRPEPLVKLARFFKDQQPKLKAAVWLTKGAATVLPALLPTEAVEEVAIRLFELLLNYAAGVEIRVVRNLKAYGFAEASGTAVASFE